MSLFIHCSHCVWILYWFLVLLCGSWCPSSCLGRDSWLLYFICVVAVRILFLFPSVPWVGLHSVIVAFPDFKKEAFINIVR